jgi:phage terminase large subunit-like protein
MDCYFVGVDFGQTRDYTATAVLERAERTGEWDAVKFAWRKVVSLRLSKRPGRN